SLGYSCTGCCARSTSSRASYRARSQRGYSTSFTTWCWAFRTSGSASLSCRRSCYRSSLQRSWATCTGCAGTQANSLESLLFGPDDRDRPALVDEIPLGVGERSLPGLAFDQVEATRPAGEQVDRAIDLPDTTACALERADDRCLRAIDLARSHPSDVGQLPWHDRPAAAGSRARQRCARHYQRFARDRCGSAARQLSAGARPARERRTFQGCVAGCRRVNNPKDDDAKLI